MFIFLFIMSQMVLWGTFMKMGKYNENSNQSPEYLYYIIYGSIFVTFISMLGILMSGVNIFDSATMAPYMQGKNGLLPSLFK